MKKLKLLKEALDHMEYYNNMAPFPIYDTGVVEELKDYIKIMEKAPKEEYDNIPVASCRHCLSAFIIVDENNNDICGRCGSVNEIEIYKNIHDYLLMRDNVDEE